MPIEFDSTIQMLSQSLGMLSTRHEILAANVANSETPGYQARDYEFRDTLKAMMKGKGDASSLKTTHPGHLSGGGAVGAKVGGKVVMRGGGLVGYDRNTVILEKEMAELALNAMEYNANVRILTKKLAGIRYAIDEGGR